MNENLKQNTSNLSELFRQREASSAQKDSFESFMRTGFPTTSEEYWKYTDLGRFTKRDFSISDVGQASGAARDYVNKTGASVALLFVNGRLAEVIGDVKGLSIAESEGALGDEVGSGPLKDLNCAFQPKTVSISIDQGAVVDEPIVLVNTLVSSGDNVELASPRLSVKVGSGAQARFVDLQLSDGDANSWVNSFSHFQIDNAAQVEILKLVRAADQDVFVGETIVSQGRDSFFGVTTLTAGGELVRQSYQVDQVGENANTECNGLYLSDGAEHADHRVVMNHLKPHGRSRQLYKGVLKGKSRAVFNGKIYIEKDAQKIDSNQLNTNLILSKYAEADSKPELEVYADDVKANHGSAIGRLDESQLFYLMSRAISRAEAIQFLAKGFVRDVSLQIHSAKLRSLANDWIEKTFADFQRSIEEDARALGGKG